MSGGRIEAKLAGWGNYPVGRSAMIRPERVAAMVAAITDATARQTMIARGSGLAYGDAAINGSGTVLATARLNKFIAFDRSAGRIRCQAGTRLEEIIALLVPHGWFLAVTPGTSRASVGGCIACDVHGKNHHAAGSFGDHLVDFTLLTAAGEVLTCSPQRHSDLFWATVGGMGLTGMILDATIALRPITTSWVVQRNIVTRDLEDTLRILTETHDAAYSVAWLDATASTDHRGRGVVMLGEHATPQQLPESAKADPLGWPTRGGAGLPKAFPGVLRGAPIARLLNGLIYRRYASSDGRERAVTGDAFFYPLDGLRNWNRLYGAAGFIEYQIVIPEQGAAPIIRAMLDDLATAGQPSFFSSMKRMGKANAAPLSFPAQGIALSFDVPVHPEIFALLDKFDDRVAAAGGRVYLAKDGRCRADVIDAFYPRRREWRAVVERHDPDGRLGSDLSRRVGLRAA